MHWLKHAAAGALLGCLLLGLVGCRADQPFLTNTPTIYDLTQRPAEFANKDVTAIGFYLWKPGDPALSILTPGLNSADGIRDAQPIYASVECASNGTCAPSATIGVPSTGAVWVDNFPQQVSATLHTPADSVWGVVEVKGRFETGGGFGPDKSYQHRLQVTSARSLENIERIVATLPQEPPGEGKVSFPELVDRPEQYAGKEVTTQAYYYWSQPTSGLLTEAVTREKSPDNEAGVNPMPSGKAIALDGFPPELSAQLHLGENNSYVWGLVEVTGTFESGGTWGPNGEYTQHFTITNGQVKVLERKQ